MTTMNVREKLVEQLREVASKTPPICRYDNPDEIEHFGKTITVYCKPFEQFQELMRDAADYIANGVAVQEWISVKDRLPDYFTSVLVWCPGNKCIYAAYRNARQEWYTFDDTIAGHVVVNMVTHWMPMPAPPKGE